MGNQTVWLGWFARRRIGHALSSLGGQNSAMHAAADVAFIGHISTKTALLIKIKCYFVIDIALNEYITCEKLGRGFF